MASPKFSAKQEAGTVPSMKMLDVFRETEQDCTVANRNTNFNSQNLGKRKRNSFPVR